jgi:DNA-binding response OmpR family regulator
MARAKLIAITGYGQAGGSEQARTAGFDGYLVKPVDLDQLCARIHAILAGERGDAAAASR